VDEASELTLALLLAILGLARDGLLSLLAEATELLALAWLALDELRSLLGEPTLELLALIWLD